MHGWGSSDRRSRLPPDWAKTRVRIGRRDNWACQWTEHGTKCLQAATDCDHIRRGDDHSDGNLRMLCRHHHKIKSASEGGNAHAQARAEYRQKMARPVEKNPTGTVITKPKYPGF